MNKMVNALKKLPPGTLIRATYTNGLRVEGCLTGFYGNRFVMTVGTPNLVFGFAGIESIEVVKKEGNHG